MCDQTALVVLGYSPLSVESSALRYMPWTDQHQKIALASVLLSLFEMS
jgi:hypothetical protein